MQTKFASKIPAKLTHNELNLNGKLATLEPLILRRINLRSIFLFFSTAMISSRVFASTDYVPSLPIPRDLTTYPPASDSLMADLAARAAADPLNLISAILFVLAILHTFASPKIMSLSHRSRKITLEKESRRVRLGRDMRTSQCFLRLCITSVN